MAIYTRTGDKGQTSLFNGQRVSKGDLRIQACGTVDELNSVLGIVLSSRHKVVSIKNELIKIQNDLFSIGSSLACIDVSNLGYLRNRVKTFENEIDVMTDEMPPLSNFILPSGGKTGSMLHFARTVCRRAERKVARLADSEKIDNAIIMYLNRLSDLLFTMARFVNFKEKKKEVIWVKK